MGKLFENTMPLDTTEAFDKILKVQTETYGVFEIQRISKLISENNIKTVLDIGTGEGSFILNLASKMKKVSFIGVDHSDDFLKRANALKNEMGISNVEFKKVFFDQNFPKDKYDMILTRFTLQHASKPKEFIECAYNRLNANGIFLIIDEYLLDTKLNDHVWKEFYNNWIQCFKLAGANHLMPACIAPDLKKAGFQHIENTIHLYSPTTIGNESFKTLALSIFELSYKIYPEVWGTTFFPKFKKWLEEITKTNEVDPFIPMAHVIARK